MFQEVATIRIHDGADAEFLAAVEQAVPLFQAAKGCRGMRLDRVVETPSLYRLVVLWDTIDDHMVAFRGSDDFQKWRALVGPFFAEPPAMDHAEVAVAGFGER